MTWMSEKNPIHKRKEKQIYRGSLSNPGPSKNNTCNGQRRAVCTITPWARSGSKLLKLVYKHIDKTS